MTDFLNITVENNLLATFVNMFLVIVALDTLSLLAWNLKTASRSVGD